ncbi:hypothetical protein SLUN_00310 [Streptomyces lunaelactis]|uniref:Uncharacterized protein n=1 Tax=Streptomyces lunaelactis TaxID=1535768 RepID=A0A2R4SVN0_9ACTN|nr:hypothetical protein [Streptomyces lunaelactis]AVZ70939.1 hypothetical protein SLUN_00310 [Streptomyces lunaelactis]NUK27622.1 hypothetical protein [Streptomyces lunaelactis]NUK88086.1 hypothetical protein [Streptomyces lunaelactis]
MSRVVWQRPAAGREPAATALLEWLVDPAAPRLCLISGSAECGKSSLLAWLVRHASRSDTPVERTVHAFVPIGRESVQGAVWALADQLGVVARAPGELVQALANDRRRTVIVLADLHASIDPDALAELVLTLWELEHVRLIVETRSDGSCYRSLTGAGPAVMDLDDPKWTDPARYQAWRETQPEARHASVANMMSGAGPAAALDDPAAICSADPLLVTGAYEADPDEHGGLRTAWLRAGQSLCHDQESAERALVLLTALGDGADPRLRPALAELAAAAPWDVLWSRVRGDVRPPWPGPAVALCPGRGLLEGQLLVADHVGAVRIMQVADAAPSGRLAQPALQTTALASLTDGTVLALDSHSQLHVQQVPSADHKTGSGLAALLDDGPTPTERLVQAVTAQLAKARGTALAATERDAAVGDAQGSVHVVNDAAEATGHSARLHRGCVTAMAAVDLPAGDEGTPLTLFYSGGSDGTVRCWAPAGEPLPTPVAQRSCPVVALDAAHVTAGLVLAIGWADGIVEYRRLDTGDVRFFCPGPPVNAVGVTQGEELLIGTDEALICLRPR